MTRLILVATVFMLASGSAEARHKCDGVYNPKIAKIYVDHSKSVIAMNNEMAGMIKDPKISDKKRMAIINANYELKKHWKMPYWPILDCRVRLGKQPH